MPSMRSEQMDCVSPDRSPEELRVLKGKLAANSRSLRRTSEHYALFAGETRLKILVLLRETGELCVCDLATVLGMTPAAVSQHLSRLRTGGVVKSRRDGMTIYYRLAETADPLVPEPIPGLRSLEK